MNHLSDRINNGFSATTDMMVDYIANPEKIVEEQDIQLFQKHTSQFKHNEQKKHIQSPAPPPMHHDDDDDDDNLHIADELENFRKSHHPPPPSMPEPRKEEFKKASDTETEKHKSESEKPDPEDESTWTKEELALRKLDMLRKLGELSRAGVTLSTNYGMSSDYKTMKFEYELHTSIRSKQNSLGWMSNMMIGIVQGIELLNDNFNPVDIKFDNMWSNDVRANISNYYDVMGEIYEKYTTPGKSMAPELKLFLMLTGSAVSIQMHKGIATTVAGLSNSSGELDNDPEKFAEMKRKMDEFNAQQKASQAQRENIKKKAEEENKKAVEKMHNMHLLKQQEDEYERMKMESKNVKTKFGSLLASESVKSTGSEMRKNASSEDVMKKIKQQEQLREDAMKKFDNTMEQQNKRQRLAEENKKLAEATKKLAEMQIPKNISKRSHSSSSSSSSASTASSSSASSSESNQSDIRKPNKPQLNRLNLINQVSDTRSTASTTTSIKNPNLNKILKKNETSSVTQHDVMTKEEFVNSLPPEISIGNTKDRNNKKSRPLAKKVISTQKK
jgi:hypothetical protein